MNDEEAETTEVQETIDVYDYVFLGVPSILIILAAIAFFFKKTKIKISKSGVEIETERNEKKGRKENNK